MLKKLHSTGFIFMPMTGKPHYNHHSLKSNAVFGIHYFDKSLPGLKDTGKLIFISSKNIRKPRTLSTSKPLNPHFYSHSIVAGGFELMSYTTRFTPLTLLMMSLDTLAKNS